MKRRRSRSSHRIELYAIVTNQFMTNVEDFLKSKGV